MRSIIAAVGLGLVLLTVGCNTAPHRRKDGMDGKDMAYDQPPPSTEALVRYMNANAQLLKQGEALNCTSLTIDCKADGKTFGLGGSMMCAKPRNFRLQAQLLGQPAVDIGSNDTEFWYWISKNEPPYLFHCSYDALSRGASIPFPFQPDMVVDALGLAEYDPTKKYELKAPPKANYYELIESAVSPQGQPIQKVTVFNRTEAKLPAPQVLAHVLRDAKGNTICIARITSVQQNRENGAIYPRIVTFEWPAQKIQMKMELNNLQVVKVDEKLAERVFTRKNLGYQSYDLATRMSDGPGNLQRTGATTMPQR
jgi:hypothetical protein